MKKENISAYLTLLLTFILWGSIYVVSSYATNVYSPVVVACVRYVVAMLPLSIMARGKLNIKIAREDIKDLLIVALLGYYFTITINTVGIKLSGASMSSLINSMVPVGVTLVAAKVLLPERMEAWNGRIAGALEQNMDVQSVFNAVGRAFSGEEEAAEAAEEIYRYFHQNTAGTGK